MTPGRGEVQPVAAVGRKLFVRLWGGQGRVRSGNDVAVINVILCQLLCPKMRRDFLSQIELAWRRPGMQGVTGRETHCR
jgi:hypothetical protein